MQVNQPGTVTAEMNVTPMIDVLLVLIIVGIILLLLQSSFPISVPPLSNDPAVAPQPAIVLELDATGGYLVNRLKVSEARLEPRLRALFLRRPTRVLFVRAAGQRAYKDVIHAIEVARSAGVEVIGYMP
jgi:biopolymer transport protein ExbD